MLNFESFSISFRNENVQNFLSNAVWRDYSPEQKDDLLDQMLDHRNNYAMINIFPRTRMIECSFKRTLEECSFVAGKWVELEDFQAFLTFALPLKED